jgi:hypothetical protein
MTSRIKPNKRVKSVSIVFSEGFAYFCTPTEAGCGQVAEIMEWQKAEGYADLSIDEHNQRDVK